MADPLPPTPFSEKLSAELRTLHEKREREPLDAREEARYAELWAWWQARARGGDDGDAAAAPQPGPAAADVPEEWLAAFGAPEDERGVAAAGGNAGAPAAQDDDALVREWEAWRTQRPEGDPFSRLPAIDPVEPEPLEVSEQEIMAARAEALGDGGGATELGAPDDASASASAGGESGADAAEPPRPATAAPAQRRVVIHLGDGQVRRGRLSYVRLDVDDFVYVSQTGETEKIARADVRAIFFMRDPGEPAPQPAGRAVRVSFRDGRELAGFSDDHDRISDAFTLVPSDPRSTASLVWIARSAVRQVS